MQAMQGSLEHLEQLVPILREDDNVLLWETLPVIYHYLPPITQVALRPSRSSKVVDHRPHYGALTALWLLLSGLGPRQLVTPRVRQSLMDHWPSIWEWCRFLTEEYVQDTALETEEQKKVHFVTIGVLVQFSGHALFGRVMGATSGVMTFLMRVWSVEQGRIYEISASLVLSRLMSATPPLLHPFVASLGNLPVEFTQPCLQRIVKMIQRPHIVYAALLGDLHMMFYCVGQPKLHGSLMAKDSVSIATQAMSRLTSRTMVVDDPDGATSCLVTLTHYLLSCVKTGGLSRVVSALEGRLILAVFKAGHLLMLGDVGARLGGALADLFKAITPYLVYRSVLRRAIKSIKTVRNLGLEQSMESTISSSHPFWQSWMVFCDFTEDRYIFKSSTIDACSKRERLQVVCWNPMVCYPPFFLLSILPDFLVSCSSPQHPKSSAFSTTPLKLCDGCKMAYFCSGKCQQIGWKNGHREECRRLAATLVSMCPPSCLEVEWHELLKNRRGFPNTYIRPRRDVCVFRFLLRRLAVSRRDFGRQKRLDYN